jgi:polar amino acid transport system permease protein
MIIDFTHIINQLPELVRSIGVTLTIWLVGTAGAVVLGFFVTVGLRFGPLALRWLLSAYVEIIRGTPFLIQLFLLYYGGPFIGIALDPIPAGLFGVTVYGAAYFSEIFRAGFDAVPRGHVEAAHCLGLTRLQIIYRIEVPEMTMLVLPPAINMTVIMLKETAVLSIITVPELTFLMQAIGSQQYAFVEAMAVLACFYWGMVSLAGRIGRFAETRLSKFTFSNT